MITISGCTGYIVSNVLSMFGNNYGLHIVMVSSVRRVPVIISNQVSAIPNCNVGHHLMILIMFNELLY